MATQIEKIRKILGEKSTTQEIEIAHFTMEEKFSAIYNWKSHADVNFDLSFVESVHDKFLSYGRCTPRQIAAIDRILGRYRIDVGRWCL